ncbi:DNA-binding transcriptional activator of the SARP family [Streptomyces sp. SceaMP-e96]|uniref:AfsR/SARP family transcriptional regulator n=1 Tax=Streptomyces TaxID=1883 RepID=UPI000823E6C1|nr:MULTISPECIES: BTAD domain-containing putative transcriptional regulator [unclassified Streptomyces]MYT14206.1 SARP family transcriptional regulator [Streptomyces sp. SID4951]MYT15922.1 SARP family transcriptional regulator [Streptomyces sp. SID4951]SCK25637.1 DNA-binding transcriptional activator of the SARP family [Streptomyces sp. SceaMP-e96]SCK58432.1 DNA-binding transcriptional activator of the SARP family [Streptomyces sp. SceaMP-e96]
MEFSLLGPIAVTTGSMELSLGPAKRRSVLALLLLQPNTTVPLEQLIDSLWEDEPPEHARTVVQGHVSRLRATLAEGGAEAYGIELTTHGSAYLLRLPEELIDAHRFGELVALARPEGAPADAVPLLREALGLWRGPALTGTVTSPPFAAAAHALEERRLTAVEALGRAHGTLGEHEQAAAILYSAAVNHPLREGLIAGLMRALFRTGRQSDALEWFHRTRRLLNEELGVDPGERLRGAYEEILRAEAAGGGRAKPTGGARATGAASGGTAADGRAGASGESRSATGGGPRPAPGGAGAAGARGGEAVPGADGTRTGTPDGARAGSGSGRAGAAPRLLPRPPARFLGREDQLTALTAVLTDRATGESPLAVVAGPAGVGKTACAVQWAHLYAGSFPDGQLFADLRGFGEGDEASPAEILRDFLLALGTPPERVPGSAQAASALFRSLVAERRLLVVLDNARSSAQVRPLLPGGPRCATVVTSRSRLDGLVATDCARPVGLQTLGHEEGAALLGAMLGPDRVAEDPAAARELVDLCDGLPLALRAAAAQLTARPRWRLARLAAALRDERRRLALLSAEDTGIAAALRMSVARLSADDAQLLSALATSADGHLNASLAAALAGYDPERTQDGLDRLAEMHLVDEEATDVYTISTLTQLFARDERGESGDGGKRGTGDGSKGSDGRG